MTNAPVPPQTPVPQSPRRLPDSLWTFSTYFAEGFPYTVIRIVSALFFRDRGMSLEALGATSVFGLPWALKFLWGPQVDAYSSKRRWLILSEALLCLVILLAVPACRETNGVILVALLLFAGSWVAATHDIAIDGFYLEALDQAGQARYLGLRVMAYRIAMMTGAGAVATLGAKYGWPLAFGVSGLLLTGLCLTHWRLLPHPEAESQPAPWPSLVRILKTRPAWVVAGTALFLLALATGRRAVSGGLGQAAGLLPELIASLLFAGLMGVWLLRRRLHGWLLTHPQSFYGRAFLSFIDRPRIGVTVGFITLSRTGEYLFSSMYSPFLIDLGLKAHYGWISALVGLPCSIGGAMLGGWLIGKTSLRRMIWPFLLLQNLSILVYLPLAQHFSSVILAKTANQGQAAATPALLTAIAAAHGLDQLAAGLGTAVLMTFLMRICQPEFKASHYAIGTGLMGLTGLYAGLASGFLTHWLGYGYFFGLSFLLSLPGMLLVFSLPLEP